ncbi:MAG: GNAT family protein [Limisphaerales bacterium]
MNVAIQFPATWPVPPRQVHEGRYVRLTPLRADVDSAELYRAGHEPAEAEEIWRYLPYGPFASEADFRDWLRSVQDGADPLFFTVRAGDLQSPSEGPPGKSGDYKRPAPGRRLGMISIMRITPAHGVAELGHIWYGLAAQRTPVNTESVFLLLRHLFDDLCYRRVEWKCNSENSRSRAAALRLGFQFEGIFRQHMVVKGRNRDTAWFAMLDTDWPARKANFEKSLAGAGRSSLSRLSATARQPEQVVERP